MHEYQQNESDAGARGLRWPEVLSRFNAGPTLPLAAVFLVVVAFLFARSSAPENASRVIQPVMRVATGNAPSENLQRHVTVVAQGGIILDRLREAQEGKWSVSPAQIWTFDDESSALGWFGSDGALAAGSDADTAAAQSSMSWVIAGDGHIAVYLANPSVRGLSAILLEAGTGQCQSESKSRWLAIWITKGPDVGGVIPEHEGGILFAPFDNSFRPTCAVIRKIYTY
jgi:hypothetical protein